MLALLPGQLGVELVEVPIRSLRDVFQVEGVWQGRRHPAARLGVDLDGSRNGNRHTEPFERLAQSANTVEEPPQTELVEWKTIDVFEACPCWSKPANVLFCIFGTRY